MNSIAGGELRNDGSKIIMQFDFDLIGPYCICYLRASTRQSTRQQQRQETFLPPIQKD